MTVSRLAERLKELLNARGLTQAEVVRRSEGIDKYVSKGTVSTYLSNPPLKPKRQVIEAFAEILDVPVSDLEEAATFTGREPFVPDPSADRLTPPQRAVLNELIRVMTDANEKGGEGNAGDPAPMNPAGGSPAPDDGIGAFGHRDRGDLDHENINDGAGDNVHQLHPDLAAYDTGTETEKERQLREEAERQDESQDPDDHR